MTGGGGPTEVHILYPKRSQLQNQCLPIKITTFLVYPKNSLSPFFATQKKSLSFFSRPKKIPASFIDPNKSLLARISDSKTSLGPPPQSLKYVSGAPGRANSSHNKQTFIPLRRWRHKVRDCASIQSFQFLKKYSVHIFSRLRLNLLKLLWLSLKSPFWGVSIKFYHYHYFTIYIVWKMTVLIAWRLTIVR